jgi:hypothetical protein
MTRARSARGKHPLLPPRNALIGGGVAQVRRLESVIASMEKRSLKQHQVLLSHTELCSLRLP